MIAELPLGFWWTLLSAQYNRSLWPSCLRHAFEGKVRRQALHSALDIFRLLRNRIAHHEPIHTRSLVDDYALIRDTAGRISPILRQRIDSTSRVATVLKSRPIPPDLGADAST
ncbi:hypothetical protein [Microlunatus parietis]|uniref:Abi-like protein n=1 Tax=Microlunatus parietis TaxID=682979 RepID=A0A7Y9I5Y2_9ACTN|nr:hypothetical protein [Microlunatus parietis]NYE70882.1 hypothetical protein [Microlunatus parietis]